MTQTQAAVRTSPVTFAGQTRFHIGMAVTHIEASVAFYEKVFACAPIKVRGDYAKFEPAEPSVNFTLNLSDEANTEKSTLTHFGIQLKDTGHLARQRERLDAGSWSRRHHLDRAGWGRTGLGRPLQLPLRCQCAANRGQGGCGSPGDRQFCRSDAVHPGASARLSYRGRGSGRDCRLAR